MVQILPPKTNVGSQIGQSLGQGLQQGINQGLQRGLLQNALKKVEGLGQPNAEGKSPSPFELASALMSATAGIPGAERYVGQLFPLLLKNIQSNELYGKEAGQEGANGIGTQAPPTRRQASQDALKFVQGEQPSGFLSSPMNPQQLEEYAEKYATTLNDPLAYDQGLQQAQNINNQRLEARNSLQNAAIRQGIRPDEMPRFMQSATEFQNLNDLPAIERAAIDKTLQIRNQKDSLKNLSVPGIGTTLLDILNPIKHGQGVSSDKRQKFLKNYDGIVKKLVNEGEEPFVRETLQKVGLSPTEIEARIHPLTDQIQGAINRLPEGNKMNAQSRENGLVNFFRDNVNNDTSLTVLRRALVKDKKYPWQEVAQAINRAFPEGRNLTKYQDAELPEIAKPPRDSLLDIFSGAGSPLDFFRGKI